MTRPRETVLVPSNEARNYLGKAEEFQRAAARELAAGDRNAAGFLAIHAGITAADALTIHFLGLRSAGQRHLDVLALLGQTAHPRKADIQRQLTELLGEKKSVEYEGRQVSVGDSEKMVKLSARIVEAARAVAIGDWVARFESDWWKRPRTRHAK
jgi:HEPN domain-containing protein